MKEIILIGGGGHCKSVIDVIEQESQFVIVGIVDKPKLIGTDVLDYPVIGSDSDLESLAKIYTYALVTVGQIPSSCFRKHQPLPPALWDRWLRTRTTHCVPRPCRARRSLPAVRSFRKECTYNSYITHLYKCI